MAEGKKHTELLPCPFCGGRATHVSPYSGKVPYVTCTNCFSATLPDSNAIERWNTRAAVNTVEGLVKALEFYSQPVRYQGPNRRHIENDPYARPGDSYCRDVTRDGGDIARSALSRFRSLQNGGAK